MIITYFVNRFMGIFFRGGFEVAADKEFVFKEHPCFGPCKKNKARIHLPVSPGCNIECRFCDRKLNESEQRPGVTSTVISADEAEFFVRTALEKCPELTVVGIAGPGDTLATPFALQVFRMIKEKFPKLIKCMSTNGLLLPEKSEEIAEVGIDTLTVTVNSVKSSTEAKINRRIFFHGKTYEGEEAAEILIKNQLEGIRRVSKSGTLIKVNTVLIPGVNDSEIEDIAATVKECGATIYNIIPLIPQLEFAETPAPTCAQLAKAREDAEPFINIFRHCQHCRADAVGVPGVYDIGSQIYLGKLSAKETFSHG